MTQALNRLRIALNVATMTDAELLQLVVAIVALAPKSALMSIQAIADSVAAVTVKGATFKAADEAVIADEEQLKKDKTAKFSARGALENEVTSLAGLVGTNAKDGAQAATLAFHEREAPTVATAHPEIPTAIDVVNFKKVHGRCKASVHELPGTKGRYVAEWSPDPIGPNTWASLPGTGKSRTISGATGSKVWVRFARVRAQLQSEWSIPVLITIP